MSMFKDMRRKMQRRNICRYGGRGTAKKIVSGSLAGRENWRGTSLRWKVVQLFL